MKFELEVEEYLMLKSKKTAQIYRSGLSKFLTFYRSKHGKDKNFSHFLDKIFNEFKKPQREQKRVAESEISQFVSFLRDEGLSNNAIRLYFASVQNFLKYKQVTVSMSFIDIPPPVAKNENGKHEWKIDQLKQFVETAQSYRDKAIILCMFQSGLGVNEICELNYGDVQAELEADVLPLCLKLVRKKTSVEFKTFFGRDAVKYLKLYLATRTDLKSKSPLFAKERIRKNDWRITPELIQQAFSETAKKVDFIKLTDNTYNPARPHSLRAAFNSRLVNKIDETLREFWMGHNIGTVAKAYLTMPTDEMRKLYMAAEEYLYIEKTSRAESENKAKMVKVPPEVEAKVKLLEDEVVKQRDRMATQEAKMQSLKEQLEIAVRYINFIDYEAKENKEKLEAQEQFKKLTAEVLKEHPLAEKPKKKL